MIKSGGDEIPDNDEINRILCRGMMRWKYSSVLMSRFFRKMETSPLTGEDEIPRWVVEGSIQVTIKPRFLNL